MLFEEVGEEFKPYLQSQVTIMFGNRVYKKGRLLLYTNVYNLIELLIAGDQEFRIEIPLPFAMEAYPDDSLIYFDYRIKHITDRNLASLDLVNALTAKTKPHKFYNGILTFEFK